MNSKKSIPSSKSLLSIDTKKMINLKCKKDSFAYKKNLSIKKNNSSYTSAYSSLNKTNIDTKLDGQSDKKVKAPSSLNQSLFQGSLHQSALHFSQKKQTKLPAIQVGSSYNHSFHAKSQDNLVKGKPKDGYFMKLPWHQNPISNYQKSYETPKIDLQNSLQKGKPHESQIKAQSNYDQTFIKTMQRSTTLHVDSTNFIKAKDHLKGIGFQMKGQSEYKSRFSILNDKQNRPSQKSLGSKKKINVLPEISRNKNYQKEQIQKLPKRSIAMKKSVSSPLQDNSNNLQAKENIPSN